MASDHQGLDLAPSETFADALSIDKVRVMFRPKTRHPATYTLKDGSAGSTVEPNWLCVALQRMG